jgi:uncharacterized protein with HEPN domain
MSPSGIEYLKHILDEIDYLLKHSKNITRSKFIHDVTLQRAFIRSIEIIGEASKKLPDTIRKKYPHVQWKAMAGMRDKLIHDYFGVDYELVWDVIANKIPALHSDIKLIINNEQ